MRELAWFENSEKLTLPEIIPLEGRFRLDSLIWAAEAALEAQNSSSEAARTFLGVCGLEREVHNGGFNQFFFNSSGKYASHIVDSLDRIGSVKIRSIARDAIECIGAAPHWGAEEFHFAAAESSDEIDERLDALDEEYYDARQIEDIDALLWGFLIEHAAEL